jgi:hypothetical protein
LLREQKHQNWERLNRSRPNKGPTQLSLTEPRSDYKPLFSPTQRSLSPQHVHAALIIKPRQRTLTSVLSSVDFDIHWLFGNIYKNRNVIALAYVEVTTGHEVTLDTLPGMNQEFTNA